MVPPKVREGPSLPLPGFWWLLAVTGIPGMWMRQSGLRLCLHMAFSLWEPESSAHLRRTPVILHLGPALLQHDLILINYICNDSISK